MRSLAVRTVASLLPLLLGAACSGRPPASGPAPDADRADHVSGGTAERVVLESDGWRLIGDWQTPAAGGPFPAALLLHRAAGSREEYVALADALARRGVASLRLDLRANGESDNLGRFEPPFAEHLHLLEGSSRDVEAALVWLKTNPEVDAGRVAAIGASYSGEAIAEALRGGGEKAAAYVMLSPGSFSDASIEAVDASGAAWLFVRTIEEGPASREVMDALFEVLERRSESAEIRVLEGAGHATRIFDTHPSIIEEIADWLGARLAAQAAAR